MNDARGCLVQSWQSRHRFNTQIQHAQKDPTFRANLYGIEFDYQTGKQLLDDTWEEFKGAHPKEIYR